MIDHRELDKDVAFNDWRFKSAENAAIMMSQETIMMWAGDKRGFQNRIPFAAPCSYYLVYTRYSFESSTVGN